MPGANPPRVPEGLRDLMKNLTKEVLREKPSNLFEFSAQFFENLVEEHRDFRVKAFEPVNSYDFIKSRERNQFNVSLIHTIIPEGLTELVKEFIKAVLRQRPENICEFAVEYFRGLQKVKNEQLGRVEYTAYENFFKSKERFTFTPYVKCTCGRTFGEGLATVEREQYELIKEKKSTFTSTEGGEVGNDEGNKTSDEHKYTNNKNLKNTRLSQGNYGSFEQNRIIHAAFVIQRFFRRYMNAKKSKANLPQKIKSSEDSKNVTKMSELAAAIIIQKAMRRHLLRKKRQQTAVAATPIPTTTTPTTTAITTTTSENVAVKAMNLTQNQEISDNVSEAASYTSASTGLLTTSEPAEERIAQSDPTPSATSEETVIHNQTIFEEVEQANSMNPNDSQEIPKSTVEGTAEPSIMKSAPHDIEQIQETLEVKNEKSMKPPAEDEILALTADNEVSTKGKVSESIENFLENERRFNEDHDRKKRSLESEQENAEGNPPLNSDESQVEKISNIPLASDGEKSSLGERNIDSGIIEGNSSNDIEVEQSEENATNQKEKLVKVDAAESAQDAEAVSKENTESWDKMVHAALTIQKFYRRYKNRFSHENPGKSAIDTADNIKQENEVKIPTGEVINELAMKTAMLGIPKETSGEQNQNENVEVEKSIENNVDSKDELEDRKTQDASLEVLKTTNEASTDQLEIKGPEEEKSKIDDLDPKTEESPENTDVLKSEIAKEENQSNKMEKETPKVGDSNSKEEIDDGSRNEDSVENPKILSENVEEGTDIKNSEEEITNVEIADSKDRSNDGNMNTDSPKNALNEEQQSIERIEDNIVLENQEIIVKASTNPPSPSESEQEAAIEPKELTKVDSEETKTQSVQQDAESSILATDNKSVESAAVHQEANEANDKKASNPELESVENAEPVQEQELKNHSSESQSADSEKKNEKSFETESTGKQAKDEQVSLVEVENIMPSEKSQDDEPKNVIDSQSQEAKTAASVDIAETPLTTKVSKEESQDSTSSDVVIKPISEQLRNESERQETLQSIEQTSNSAEQTNQGASSNLETKDDNPATVSDLGATDNAVLVKESRSMSKEKELEESKSNDEQKEKLEEIAALKDLTESSDAVTKAVQQKDEKSSIELDESKSIKEQKEKLEEAPNAISSEIVDSKDLPESADSVNEAVQRSAEKSSTDNDSATAPTTEESLKPQNEETEIKCEIPLTENTEMLPELIASEDLLQHDNVEDKLKANEPAEDVSKSANTLDVLNDVSKEKDEAKNNTPETKLEDASTDKIETNITESPLEISSEALIQEATETNDDKFKNENQDKELEPRAVDENEATNLSKSLDSVRKEDAQNNVSLEKVVEDTIKAKSVDEVKASKDEKELKDNNISESNEETPENSTSNEVPESSKSHDEALHQDKSDGSENSNKGSADKSLAREEPEKRTEEATANSEGVQLSTEAIAAKDNEKSSKDIQDQSPEDEVKISNEKVVESIESKEASVDLGDSKSKESVNTEENESSSPQNSIDPVIKSEVKSAESLEKQKPTKDDEETKDGSKDSEPIIKDSQSSGEKSIEVAVNEDTVLKDDNKETEIIQNNESDPKSLEKTTTEDDSHSLESKSSLDKSSNDQPVEVNNLTAESQKSIVTAEDERGSAEGAPNELNESNVNESKEPTVEGDEEREIHKREVSMEAYEKSTNDDENANQEAEIDGREESTQNPSLDLTDKVVAEAQESNVGESEEQILKEEKSKEKSTDDEPQPISKVNAVEAIGNTASDLQAIGVKNSQKRSKEINKANANLSKDLKSSDTNKKTDFSNKKQRKQESHNEHRSLPTPIAELQLKSFRQFQNDGANSINSSSSSLLGDRSDEGRPPLQENDAEGSKIGATQLPSSKYSEGASQESDGTVYSDSTNEERFEKDSLEVSSGNEEQFEKDSLEVSSARETDMEEDSLETERSESSLRLKPLKEEERTATYLYGVYTPKQSPKQQRKAQKAATAFVIPFDDDNENINRLKSELESRELPTFEEILAQEQNSESIHSLEAQEHNSSYENDDDESLSDLNELVIDANNLSATDNLTLHTIYEESESPRPDHKNVNRNEQIIVNDMQQLAPQLIRMIRSHKLDETFVENPQNSNAEGIDYEEILEPELKSDIQDLAPQLKEALEKHKSSTKPNEIDSQIESKVEKSELSGDNQESVKVVRTDSMESHKANATEAKDLPQNKNLKEVNKVDAPNLKIIEKQIVKDEKMVEAMDERGKVKDDKANTGNNETNIAENVKDAASQLVIAMHAYILESDKSQSDSKQGDQNGIHNVKDSIDPSNQFEKASSSGTQNASARSPSELPYKVKSKPPSVGEIQQLKEESDSINFMETVDIQELEQSKEDVSSKGSVSPTHKDNLQKDQNYHFDAGNSLSESDLSSSFSNSKELDENFLSDECLQDEELLKTQPARKRTPLIRKIEQEDPDIAVKGGIYELDISALNHSDQSDTGALSLRSLIDEVRSNSPDKHLIGSGNKDTNEADIYLSATTDNRAYISAMSPEPTEGSEDEKSESETSTDKTLSEEISSKLTASAKKLRERTEEQLKVLEETSEKITSGARVNDYDDVVYEKLNQSLNEVTEHLDKAEKLIEKSIAEDTMEVSNWQHIREAISTLEYSSLQLDEVDKMLSKAPSPPIHQPEEVSNESLKGELMRQKRNTEEFDKTENVNINEETRSNKSAEIQKARESLSIDHIDETRASVDDVDNNVAALPPLSSAVDKDKDEDKKEASGTSIEEDIIVTENVDNNETRASVDEVDNNVSAAPTSSSAVDKDKDEDQNKAPIEEDMIVIENVDSEMVNKSISDSPESKGHEKSVELSESDKNKAALIIQNVFRRLLRKKAEESKDKRETESQSIQIEEAAMTQEAKMPRESQKSDTNQAAKTIQKAFRKFLQKRNETLKSEIRNPTISSASTATAIVLEANDEEKKNSLEANSNNAAKIIQNAYRKYLKNKTINQQNELKDESTNALDTQVILEDKKEPSDLEKPNLHHAAFIIQHAFRKYLKNKIEKKTSTDDSLNDSEITAIYVGSAKRTPQSDDSNSTQDALSSDFERPVSSEQTHFIPQEATAPVADNDHDEEVADNAESKVDWFVGNDLIVAQDPNSVENIELTQEIEALLETSNNTNTNNSNDNGNDIGNDNGNNDGNKNNDNNIACLSNNESEIDEISKAPLKSENSNSVASAKVVSASSQSDDASSALVENSAKIITTTISPNNNETNNETMELSLNQFEPKAQKHEAKDESSIQTTDMKKPEAEENSEEEHKKRPGNELSPLKSESIENSSPPNMEPLPKNLISDFLASERRHSDLYKHSREIPAPSKDSGSVADESKIVNTASFLETEKALCDSDIPYTRLEEPCIKKTVSLTEIDEIDKDAGSTTTTQDNEHSDDASDEKTDTETADKSFNESLNTIAEKLHSSEETIARMQRRRSSETSLAASIEERQVKEVNFEEPVIRNMQDLQETPGSTAGSREEEEVIVRQGLQREETRESTAESDSVVFGGEELSYRIDEEQEEEEIEDEFDLSRATLKRLHTIAGDDTKILFKSVTIDETVKYIEPPITESSTITSASSLCLDDDTSENIRQKMMAYSLSEADSDGFDPASNTRGARRDDFIETLIETEGTSTETESTIVSAVTKIQAGARGFITRRRLRRASASVGTKSSMADTKASFGNDAIGESLDNMIEDEAAKKIQTAYRRHRRQNKRRENTTNTMISQKNEDKDFQHSRSHRFSSMTTSMETSLAAKRLTLQRNDALRNDSTPEDDGNGAVVEKPIESSKIETESSASSGFTGKEDLKRSETIVKKSTKTRNDPTLKWFARRQNSMPVQIDCEVFRVLPKNKNSRKRILSAEEEKKNKRRILRD